MDSQRAGQARERDDTVNATARTLTILRRFPRHLEADDPGKLFTDVVNGLGQELDVKSLQLSRVRRSHAIGDADEERDLFLLGAIHDLKPEDLDVCRLRLDAIRTAQAPLADEAASPADKQAAVADLQQLLSLEPDAFPIWPAEGTDVGPAQARLATALGELVSYPSELDLLRGTIESVIGLHRAGNGTVTALLRAGATYLDLGVESIIDTDDLYWHVATCRDLMRLVRPEPPGTRSATTAVAPKPDLLALEENPLRQQDSDPVDRRHGDRFNVLRSGFETVPVTIRVVGLGDRTIEPMVVNLDDGFGVVFTGSVPDGQELRFESDGRVMLAGSSVARLSYSFSGGVFSDATQKFKTDFVFADDSPAQQAATFAVTHPITDAFEGGATFPHTDGLLDVASLEVGESRWAFFVRAANYGRAAAAPTDELAVPVFDAGVFDTSVYKPDTSVGSPGSGKVGFSWQEHEPFAARLWIPLRFSTLDASGEVPVNERLRLLLDRHRAAGIHVYVEYADDRWTMPAGVLREAGSDEPLGTVIVGTALWAAESETPT
jgi:hypothetical protein